MRLLKHHKNKKWIPESITGVKNKLSQYTNLFWLYNNLCMNLPLRQGAASASFQDVIRSHF